MILLNQSLDWPEKSKNLYPLKILGPLALIGDPELCLVCLKALFITRLSVSMVEHLLFKTFPAPMG